MGQLLAETLPLALTIALSPFTIIPAILLLLSPRAGVTSGAFLAGWLLGLAAVATAFTLLASVVELSEDAPTWASWSRVALGLLLVGLGVRKWLQRAKPKPPPAWMHRQDGITPRRAFRLALVLAVANPKVLLLTAAAGLGIGVAELSTRDTVVAVLVFTAVAASSVIVPVLLYLVLGERIIAPLSAARGWLERHNATVMVVVFVVIGLVVLAEGVAALG